MIQILPSRAARFQRPRSGLAGYKQFCHLDIGRPPDYESGDCLPTGNSPAFWRWATFMFGFQRRKVERLDFIVPGAQKSGTTALHYFLSKHPQISLPHRQELHFFDDEEVFSRAPVDYQFLHGNFRSRRKRLRSVRSAGRTDSSRGEFRWKIDKRAIVAFFVAKFPV